MSILTLFCRIDDFYLAFEAFLTSRSLQDDKPMKPIRETEADSISCPSPLWSVKIKSFTIYRREDMATKYFSPLFYFLTILACWIHLHSRSNTTLHNRVSNRRKETFS